MADISMCNGEGCPYKDDCYRHTAPTNEIWQSYFEPAKEKDGKMVCDYYWDDKTDIRKEVSWNKKV